MAGEWLLVFGGAGVTASATLPCLDEAVTEGELQLAA